MHEDNSQDYYRSDETGRDRYRQMDDLNTRISQVNPQLPLDEESQGVAEGISAELVNEVEYFLDKTGENFESKEEYERLLQKLDTAIATTNSPQARELRHWLIKEYGTP